jgi:hypothetical protein
MSSKACLCCFIVCVCSWVILKVYGLIIMYISSPVHDKLHFDVWPRSLKMSLKYISFLKSFEFPT